MEVYWLEGAYISNASSFLLLVSQTASTRCQLPGRPDEVTLDLEVLMRNRSRYEFYETDDRLTLSIFDKGVDPAEVQIKFEPRAVSVNPDSSWILNRAPVFAS